MTQQDSGRDRLGRRAKRFLSPSQKYELWLQLATGELSQSEAAERFGIDRSTVMRIRQVAKQGALEALAASKPGVRQAREAAELAAARAEIQRLGEAVKEQAIELMLLRGNRAGVDRRRPPTCGSRHQARAAGAGRPGRRRGVHHAARLPSAAGDRAAGPPVVARSTACWTRRSSRSWSWRRSGARWTAPIASSPTAAPGWGGCGSRRPACTACWPLTTWCCPPRPPGRRSSARPGRTGWSIGPTRYGVGT